MNKEDAAYCAGLFEGEGSIASKKLENPQLQIKINMTDLEPLEQFKQMTGVGTITGPYYYEYYGPQAKGMYHYQIGSFEGAQYVIASLWNWLSPRRKKQCKEAITLYHKRRDNKKTANRFTPKQPDCELNWCDEKHWAKGYCHRHYIIFIIKPKNKEKW